MDISFESAFAKLVLDAVRLLGKGQRLRSDTLRRRLCEKTGLLPIEVEEGIRELHRRGLLLFQANVRGQPVSGYVEVVREEKVVSAEEVCWSASLMREGIEGTTSTALLPLASRLMGMAAEDIMALAKCLASLRDCKGLDASTDVGPNVSARTMMGSAKVISRIPPKAMGLLGLDMVLQSPSPRYLLHAGPELPAPPTETLLIENPQAFENAVAAGLANTMSLVCTFGFALSYVGQVWQRGTMSQKHGEPIMLQRCGRKRSIAELFGAAKVYFWGDLDVGALMIFLACRSAVPALRLSAIYHAMEPLLQDPLRSHPYAEIFDKEGQARLSAFPEQATEIEPEVRALFKRCSHRGVDQEIVHLADIARLGDASY